MKKYLLSCAALLVAVQIWPLTVIIDPGHGGKDPGVRGICIQDGKECSLLEKDVVLHIAQKTAAVLAQRRPDIRVVLTRSDDSFIPFTERKQKIQVAAQGEKTLSISIHNNGTMNASVRGFEVGAQKNMTSFAQTLSTQLTTAIGKKMPFRKIFDSSESSLMTYTMTDITLDVGFLSNKEDAALLADEGVINEFSEALANGILQYQ